MLIPMVANMRYLGRNSFADVFLSDGLIALMVGVGIGLVIVIPILWRYHGEIKRTWMEALGLTPSADPIAASEPSRGSHEPRQRFSGKRRLAIALCLAASLGNAVLALQTGDTRLLYVFGVAVFATAAGLLSLDGRVRGS
jgi:hypothetical protein